VFNSPEVTFIFKRTPGKETVVNEYWPDNNNLLFTKYIKVDLQTDQQLQAYTGIYYCPELDCRYGIKLKDHHLVLTSNKYNDIPLKLVGYDDLIDKTDLLSHIKILRDSKKKITGFEASSESVLYLMFKKIK
jgi:hypothetical protein